MTPPDPLIHPHDVDEPVPDTGGGLVRVPLDPADVLLRVRLDVAYDGTVVHGWARQPGLRTVQGDLELALSTVLRTDVALTVAGRTDAGVHATGQVAHLDLPAAVWHEHRDRLVRRLRGVLDADVSVTAAREVPLEFDARFAALRRHYVYRLTDAESGPPPLRRLDTVAWPRPVDTDRMQAAADLLLGEHDFAAFCRRRDGASTIRTLLTLDVHREGPTDDAGRGPVAIAASADAFCHSMVRSLVGALLAVGEGRRPPEWPGSLLSRTSRASDVPVAPAGGLTLVAVDYPADDELAARTLVTRNRRDTPPTA